MPEGHTIHRIASDHQRDFAGKRLQASSPQGRFEDGARELSGRKLVRVEAYGKHLLYQWQGRTLHVHLGLYGRFRSQKTPAHEPRGQVRLRVAAKDRLFDLNGPAACELLSAPQRAALLDRLGADPLRSDSDVDLAWEKIGSSRASIGALLMNQKVIAGVGNIYRAEILYLNGIHPDRLGNTLTRDEFDQLWNTAVRLLRIGKRYDRIITASPEDVGKPRSRMKASDRLLIYKKELCPRCERPIQSWEIAARTVYACDHCQR